MPPTEPLTPSDTVRRTRLLLFVGVLLVANAGPFYRHVLSGTEPVADWAMFHTKGIGGCALRFYQREGDTLTPLDAFAALGFEAREDAPPAWRRPADALAARALGRRLCRTLGAAVDVRLDVQCARAEGWVRELGTEDRICLP